MSIGYQIWDNAYTQVLRFLSGVAKDRKNDIRTVLSKYIVKNSINQIIFLVPTDPSDTDVSGVIGR